MTKLFRVNSRRGLWAVALLFLAGALAAAPASQRQVADGVAIYLGVLPAEMVRGHPKEHPESEMHGGVPVGTYHVMVALFDNASGRRITDAVVTAKVVWPDQYRVEKRLEPMTVAGSLTYGNYFRMPEGGAARIDVQIRRPGTAGVVHASFDWART